MTAYGNECVVDVNCVLTVVAFLYYREAALEQLQRQEDDIEFNQAVIEEREDNIRAIEVWFNGAYLPACLS